MADFESVIWVSIYVSIVSTAAVALYGVVTRPHIVKKLVLLAIFGDAANMLAVFAGYRFSASQPPVYPGGSLDYAVLPTSIESTKLFAEAAVDPIPQVLIVTAIVIGLAAFIFFAFTALAIAERYGTLNLNKVEESEEGGAQ